MTNLPPAGTQAPLEEEQGVGDEGQPPFAFDGPSISASFLCAASSCIAAMRVQRRKEAFKANKEKARSGGWVRVCDGVGQGM